MLNKLRKCFDKWIKMKNWCKYIAKNTEEITKKKLLINKKNLKEELLNDNNNISNLALKKQNEEYKDKIKNLEIYIKQLESKIKKKKIIITEIKDKNEDLHKKIKDLENKLNNTPKTMI